MTVIEWVVLIVSPQVCGYFAWRYEKVKRERDDIAASSMAWQRAAESWERTANEWRTRATWLVNRAAPAPNGKSPVIHGDIDPGFGLDVLEDGTTALPEKVPPKKLC